MPREMTPALAREIDWETWADAVVNTGCELSQPDVGADGGRPVTVSSARPGGTFPAVRMGIAPYLITEGSDADGRGTLIVCPGRIVMFLR